jgi:hypothetical protein
MVIDLVVARQIPNHRLEWVQAKQCHDGNCHPFDHFDEGTLNTMREEARCRTRDNELLMDWGGEVDIPKVIDNVMLDLATEHDARWEVCDERKAGWSEKIALGNPEKACSTDRKPSFEQYNKVSGPLSEQQHHFWKNSVWIVLE